MGSGNWNDISHWSDTDNGSGGFSVPTAADNVYFTSNSFSAGSATVTIDADASCFDIDWTGATNNPVLAGTFSLSISGSATFISTMSVALTGTMIFVRATGTASFYGAGLTFGNVTFPQLDVYNIYGNNTFNTLTIGAGTFIYFEEGSTQTFTNLTANGLSARPISFLSTNGSNAYTLSCSTGIITVVYCTINCCIATGGAIFNAYASTGTGTTGWNFLLPEEGSSEATVVISVEGLGMKTLYDGSSTAIVSIVPEGAVFTYKQGNAESTIIITPQSLGAKQANNASESSVIVTSDSSGIKVSLGDSESAVTISAEGSSLIIRQGDNESEIFISGEGQGTKSTTGQNDIAVAVLAEGMRVFKQLYPILSLTEYPIKLSYIDYPIAMSVTEYPIEMSCTDYPISLSFAEYPIKMEVLGVPKAGSTTTLRGEFPDTAGNLSSLTNVTVKIYDPGRTLLATLTGASVTLVSTGIYTAEYLVPETTLGQFTYEFSGTLGTKTIKDRGSFDSIWK